MRSCDVAVVGGGPAGATAARDLAAAGFDTVLLDKAGRIKPCGGAVPPRLLEEFDIPESLLCAKVRGARMISPAAREVHMPIGGWVGMVDRENFDEFLRHRAAQAGAERRQGCFEHLEPTGKAATLTYRGPDGARQRIGARMVIGADGALSRVRRQCVPQAGSTDFVFAYHEIVTAPLQGQANFDSACCDVVYDAATSPDFYAWVFPHGATASIGTGSAAKGFPLRPAVGALRARLGLDTVATIRREGAPLPLGPLRRWDNGADVLLAGDAAGCVAPASGEGIYYAMLGGRLAADAAAERLASGDARALGAARRRFMALHGQAFLVLRWMQRFWYKNDWRRERFVAICGDADVQHLTWDAYMNKRLAHARPGAHMRIFCKNIAYLSGLKAA